MLTSRSDSNSQRSNISLKEIRRDGVDLNSDGLDYFVRTNEGKILWFSADCYELKHDKLRELKVLELIKL